MTIPRPEYPRPQCVRADWLCLNGEWQFEIDPGDSGLERGLLERDLQQRITVPFCPEAPLSGIGNTDFMHAVWYRQTVLVPDAWAGRRVLLHLQAVDYDATVWVNGREVARHRGGFTPFTCDLHGVAEPGESATIVVRARDDYHVPQPRGKQAELYANTGCDYTRTTGIWQTVWLEPVPHCRLLRPRLTPLVAARAIRLDQPLTENRSGYRLRATLRDTQGVVATAECAADADRTPSLDLLIPATRHRVWSPADPHLYDVDIELLDTEGRAIDQVQSYAGLRSVTTDGSAIKINGHTIFQRLVLDQGYYPDGILTAPSDQALRRDIELSLAAGFNGARLHQKVFEERFLYHADRLGYLVWGEFPDWGCAGYGPDSDHQQPSATYITQWLEAVERDYSHPSIIGWCPLNETHQPITDRINVLDDVTRGMFLAAKALDGTRPVLDTSGYAHRVPEADVYDCHDYEQNPATFRQHYLRNESATGPVFLQNEDNRAWSIPYRGQPFFVSEFGGIWWNPEAGPEEFSWGYGDRPASLEAFHDRFAGLTETLLDDPTMFGYCYTQLTDVYQEQNGIYTFDRREKFDMTRIRRVQQRPAACEVAARK
jgi:beta-galactosidase/beta-glucuronidase